MSLLSFKELINSQYFNMNNIIKDIDSYLAHLPVSSSQEPEKLSIHANLVLEYTIKIIESNSIESRINFIVNSISKNRIFQNDIKLLFLKAIYWHDIGKINENFQIDKMLNNKYKRIDSKISSRHSILSTYLYLISSLDYINKNYQNINQRIELISISLISSMNIWRHHSGLSKSLKELIVDEKEGLPICNELDTYLDEIVLQIDKNTDSILIDNIVNGDLKNRLYKKEEYFLLSKSLFSLLIISDYYATAQFMNYGNKKNLVYDNFGLINDDFRTKVYNELYIDKYEDGKQKTFNESLKNKKDEDFKGFENLKDRSNKNLNHLRNKLFVEVRTNLHNILKENSKQNLFYIEAPTGAGKTNLSTMSAVEIINIDKTINKIFYVFPFTTLITQTYESIKKNLSLNNNEIVQLHSKAKYNKKFNNNEDKKDGIYGDEKKNFLDNQFMNYPISLLSHVKFFNVLTGVSKDDNYIFHRLANSIVIIDEIQTYSPKYWSKIAYLLNIFAKSFNIKFIIMSATLPKIGDIFKGDDFEFINLVKNKQQYFSNPNFANRVSEIVDIKENTYENIYKRLLDESIKYKRINYMKSVKTIIEFITKKGADKFYKLAKENNTLFDEIFILSGTVLEPRRKEIINFIKNIKDKNILLVTTQVVEAGVDIDMDIGFKEKSLVDSDEQLAGRINRNSSKDNCKLFLFDMGNKNFIYDKDYRKDLSAIYNEGGENKNVLKTKDFDMFYNQIIEKIIQNNKTKFITNIDDYKISIRDLRFNDIHIKLIDIESISIYIPINDMAKIYWKAYEKIVSNQEQEFVNKKILLKKLSSKLSKYTFSLAIYPNSGIEYLSPYGEEKYGYLYLEEFQTIYSYEDGLDTNVLTGNNVDMIL